jgi:glycosyltransferase involved in cell wall biosynthesis
VVRAACSYLDLMATWTFKQASAITGNGDGAVEWAVRKAGRASHGLDTPFPMAYAPEPVSPDRLAAGRTFWMDAGLDPDRANFIVVYAGVMNSRTRDLHTVIDAARLLHGSAGVTFVLCGVGEDYDELKASASGLSNVFMPGWVDMAPLQALLLIARAGLNPTRPLSNFEAGITNKPIEYLSAGLPVITTVSRGELWDEMERAGCAMAYSPGNGADLADRIRTLAADEPEWRAKSTAARELFRTRYDATIVYAAMAAWLERVAVRGSSEAA